MDQILGQAQAIDQLQAAARSDRLHHAYIFHGPPGVGKFTTALAFARLILCHQPQSDLAGRLMPCGACASCRLLSGQTHRVAPGRKKREIPEDEELVLGAAARGHPDLHVITKEMARFSDEKTIRDSKQRSIAREVLLQFLLEPAHHSAQLRHGKVFIVDEAELIDETRAQGTLLKTLEEPPAGTVLILVTAHEDRLLPTVRSRCQRIGFLPLPDATLAQVLAQDGVEMTPDDRRWLIDFAGGSLGRMRLALEYGLANWGRTVVPALDLMTRGRMDASLGGQINGLIGDFAKRWVDEHDNASKEAANKMAAGLMWSLICQHARQRMGEAARAAAGKPPWEAELTLQPWMDAIAAVGTAERNIASNVNMTLTCDHLALSLYRALAPAARAATAIGSPRK